MGRFSLFPEQASTAATRVDALLFFLLTVAAFFVLLIAGLILYFMVKYRRRSPGERGEAVHGSLALELTWTIIPLLLMGVMFVWGSKVFFHLNRPPNDAMTVSVVGKRWMWKLQHPTGQREVNELHVPVGRAVKLVITSEDTIHSFFVPAFRIKKDAVPGRYNVAWFQAAKSNPAYNNTILYANSWGSQLTDQNLSDFVAQAKPDMISFDTYPWIAGQGGAVTDWYTWLRRYRVYANDAGIPFAVYRQTYHSDSEGRRDPSPSEQNLNTFAALAFGAMLGKNPCIGSPTGALALGATDVLIGGFPVPSGLALLQRKLAGAELPPRKRGRNDANHLGNRDCG